MTKYSVAFSVSHWEEIEVEAGSLDEAVAIAYDELPHADAWELEWVDEL